ncbi:MAG: PLP-dependent aminotransferase family protein [Neptuniibacter sp.]
MHSDFLYQQLESWLLKGIQTQRWKTGERLPSIRTLCKEKGLSKATVQHALQRLEAQGLIEVRPKAGYFVTIQNKDIESPSVHSAIEAPRPVTSNDLLLDIMERSAAFDLRPNPEGEWKSNGVIELNRCLGRALRKQRGAFHQYYDDPAGDLSLREQLSTHYSRRGLRLSVGDLCITSGCQHALFLALMACCEKGDIVAVESPGFYGALQLLEQLQLKVIEVPSSSENGMNIQAFEEVLQRWPVKACMVSPSFSTPSGSVMPLAEKQQLLNLANQYDLVVIEDDIYADTALGGTPDPLKSIDSENRVILCSSFSKSLSRDLRLGWINGGRWHDKIHRMKLVTQLASSSSLQRGVAEFMTEGRFTAHLRRQRNELQTNRDYLISQLRDWPVQAKFSIAQGGLSLWVELPTRVNTLDRYNELLDQNIVITPGPLFSISGKFTNCLRISYAHRWDGKRAEALHQLPSILLQSTGG